MTKIQFLLSLNERLSGLPKADLEERLSFYSEMIEDRMEEGFSEEEAVEAVGNIDEIAEQIISDIPLGRIAKEKIKPKRSLKTVEIVLLILGAPIWLSLLIGVISIVFSVYVALWSVIIAVWSVFGALAASSVGCVTGSVIIMAQGKALSGIAVLGAGIALAGLTIFAFFACKSATDGLLWVTKKAACFVKKLFVQNKGETK